jgi:hypothetical protein
MASIPRRPGLTPRNNLLLQLVLLLLTILTRTVLGGAPSNGVTVTLTNLDQKYDGQPKVVSVVTDPPDLLVSVLYDGSPEPPSQPGSYTVWGVVLDPLFPAIAKNTLTISPVITNVAAPPDGTYGIGETLQFAVAYCGNVTVLTNAGAPSLSLQIGDSLVEATYEGGDLTDQLIFTYTIQSGDNGTLIMPEAISLNGSAIQDSGGYEVGTSFSSPSEQVIVDTTIVATPAPSDVLQIQGLDSGGVRLTVTGTPNATYVIQATDDLSAPNWGAIGVAQADTNGVGVLDVPIQPSSQFFRSMREISDGQGPAR